MKKITLSIINKDKVLDFVYLCPSDYTVEDLLKQEEIQSSDVFVTEELMMDKAICIDVRRRTI